MFKFFKKKKKANNDKYSDFKFCIRDDNGEAFVLCRDEYSVDIITRLIIDYNKSLELPEGLNPVVHIDKVMRFDGTKTDQQ